MTTPHLVEVESWRDFIAEAPNFNITVYSGQPVRIALDELLKQGATDIDDFESPLSPEKDPLYSGKNLSMRGWQYYPIINGEPTRGTVKVDEYGAGFLYESSAGYIGGDCFNYVLTNGKQQSSTGKISITILPWYELQLTATLIGDGTYSMDATIIVPEGEPEPDIVIYYWRYSGPHLELGRVVYGDHPSAFHSTWLRGYHGDVTTYTYRRVGNYIASVTPPNDILLANEIDATTGVTFIPKNELPDIVVSARIFVNGSPMTLTGTEINLSTSFNDQVGGGLWSESGAVIDPNAPSQDDILGIITPPFAARTVSAPISETNLIPDVN